MLFIKNPSLIAISKFINSILDLGIVQNSQVILYKKVTGCFFLVKGKFKALIGEGGGLKLREDGMSHGHCDTIRWHEINFTMTSGQGWYN